jgi:hypothetical protein
METNNPKSQQNPGPAHTPKPRPIYIQDVTSTPPLLQLLEQYETKALADKQVKFNLRLLIPIIIALAEKQTEFHTYNPKRSTLLQNSAPEHALFHIPCRYQD